MGVNSLVPLHSSVADPEGFDADVDPDPTFYVDADPDPNLLSEGENKIFVEIFTYFFQILQNLT